LFKYYELEQYEDILQTIEYVDTDLKEYYEKLKEVLKDNFIFSKTNPFVFDKKLTKAIKVKENGTYEIDLNELYPGKEIDVIESLFLQNLENKKENILNLLRF